MLAPPAPPQEVSVDEANDYTAPLVILGVLAGHVHVPSLPPSSARGLPSCARDLPILGVLAGLAVLLAFALGLWAVGKKGQTTTKPDVVVAQRGPQAPPAAV